MLDLMTLQWKEGLSWAMKDLPSLFEGNNSSHFRNKSMQYLNNMFPSSSGDELALQVSAQLLLRPIVVHSESEI